jgi:hypothetical protein
MEMRLTESATVIQRHARGMIARVAYKKRLEQLRIAEKEKLSNMLSDLQT